MTEKGSFILRNRNPDVLTCIANLSNDEVFTPPELANKMLDEVEAAWARDHNGENIWENKDVKFLDPCTKSGIFLREITKRLTQGLVMQIPNLEERVDHILRKQVYGIALTKLTSLLARRSVYCSKDADGKHSIAKSLNSKDGNVWYENLSHTWVGDKCKFCGAPKSIFDRAKGFDSHAYAFIHTDSISSTINKIFGEEMQFDVIIGNPPYQLSSDGGTRDLPIYQLFVEQAKKIKPRYIAMVTPSRWMAGGLGLSKFRKEMLSDRRLKSITDYPVAQEVFSGVEVKGGVSYFLWDSSWNKDCDVTVVRKDSISGPHPRKLDAYDLFFRDSLAIPILEKVLSKNEPSMSEIISSRTAFGFYSNYSKYRKEPKEGDILYYATNLSGRFTGWVSRDDVTVNQKSIDSYKVLFPKAGSDGGKKLPDIVLGKSWIAENPSVCTQSFLFVQTKTKKEAENIASYYRTRFLRFLVSLRKISIDTTASSYLWVPQQDWGMKWTDEILYKKYGLTIDEQNHIQSHVKQMMQD